MSAWINDLTAFIGAHPHWAGVLVFLVAGSEAVVMIGYIVPGAAILIAVGGVVGLGHLPLLPILVWAAAGAIVGDGLSYWLGHVYKEELRRRWPFSRYPDLIDRGEVFLHRHGAKSVFLGRFIPVLKPIVPTVAGILGMPPGRFYVANVLSAIIWSPAHILPGVLLGASIGLLHGISARLVVAVLGFAGLLVLLVWGTKLAVARLAPMADRAHRSTYEWAIQRRGTLFHRVAMWFDPDHPGTPALFMVLVILVGSSFVFVGVLEDILTGDPLVKADRAINHFVSGLRNPLIDPIMVTVTSMGDSTVIIPLIVMVLGWLAVARAWKLAIAVSIALGVAATAVVGLKALVQIPRPEAMYAGVDAFAFPSGHTAMATVLFGLTAWLVAGGLGPRARVIAYVLSFGWVLAIGVSRIYLGAHWPSDVLAGLFLGTLLCAAVAIFYRHAPRGRLRPARFAVVFAAIFISVGVWHVTNTYEQQVDRYTPHTSTQTIAAVDWWTTGWRSLAANRVDLIGEQEESLSLQWLGTDDALRVRLLAGGWQAPPRFSLINAVNFLKPSTSIAELPATSVLNDGLKNVILLVHDTGLPGERWVLRAWPSGFEATSGDQRYPLLLASVVKQHEIHPGQMLTLPQVADAEIPLGSLLDSVGGKTQVRDDGRIVRLATENDVTAVLTRRAE